MQGRIYSMSMRSMIGVSIPNYDPNLYDFEIDHALKFPVHLSNFLSLLHLSVSNVSSFVGVLTAYLMASIDTFFESWGNYIYFFRLLKFTPMIPPIAEDNTIITNFVIAAKDNCAPKKIRLIQKSNR